MHHYVEDFASNFFVKSALTQDEHLSLQSIDFGQLKFHISVASYFVRYNDHCCF
jgi:hypothetical protein